MSNTEKEESKNLIVRLSFNNYNGNFFVDLLTTNKTTEKEEYIISIKVSEGVCTALSNHLKIKIFQ